MIPATESFVIGAMTLPDEALGVHRVGIMPIATFRVPEVGFHQFGSVIFGAIPHILCISMSVGFRATTSPHRPPGRGSDLIDPKFKRDLLTDLPRAKANWQVDVNSRKRAPPKAVRGHPTKSAALNSDRCESRRSPFPCKCPCAESGLLDHN